jgi:hypothetical protein
MLAVCMPQGWVHALQVAFSHQLDMFDLCSKDLQAKLRGPRKAYGDITDAKAGIAKDKAGDAAEGAHTHPRSATVCVCVCVPQVSGLLVLIAK